MVQTLLKVIGVKFLRLDGSCFAPCSRSFPKTLSDDWSVQATPLLSSFDTASNFFKINFLCLCSFHNSFLIGK